MIDIGKVQLTQVAVHTIGRKDSADALRLSTEPIDLSDHELVNMLTKFFTSHFKFPEYFSFTFSNEDFNLNPIYQFVSAIFSNELSFHDNSINLAKHLHSVSEHPNIKPGDLYCAYFNSIPFDNLLVNAIGIYKSETREKFLKLDPSSTNYQILKDEGVSINKLDKGCLIFNIESETGYKICVVDNVNREDALFWKQNFLNVKPTTDSYQRTQGFMALTRQYVADQLDEEFSVSKADKIDLLNRSMDFFKKRDQFNKAEFELEVLNDADVIESFRSFGKSALDPHDWEASDAFEISAHAVKRQARVFKSVLKLDKNFHVYIHGNRELLEKGFDESKGKHYYKLYFENES